MRFVPVLFWTMISFREGTHHVDRSTSRKQLSCLLIAHADLAKMGCKLSLPSSLSLSRRTTGCTLYPVPPIGHHDQRGSRCRYPTPWDMHSTHARVAESLSIISADLCCHLDTHSVLSRGLPSHASHAFVSDGVSRPSTPELRSRTFSARIDGVKCENVRFRETEC